MFPAVCFTVESLILSHYTDIFGRTDFISLVGLESVEIETEDRTLTGSTQQMQIEAYVTESQETLDAHTFMVVFIDSCEYTQLVENELVAPIVIRAGDVKPQT